MIEIKINNTTYTVEQDETILSVAQRAGIDIPTMCWLKDFSPSTSCMVCLVQDKRNGKLLTSCSVKAEQGMDIETDNPEIADMRKSAIELLLSEHAGDCEAPCQRVCPAEMDIPLMNRLIASGKMHEALQNVVQTIALPSILGYICPAPCEKACRRKDIDEPVSICLLKRFVGENESIKVSVAAKKEMNVAVVGAGPAGLAAAYYLALHGFDCTVFDNNALPGGKMRTDIPEERLPRKVLDTEIENIRSMGVVFNQNMTIDESFIEKQLAGKYDFILLAIGAETALDLSRFTQTGLSEIRDLEVLKAGKTVILAPRQIPSKSKMAVRAAALGRKLCEWTLEYLSEGSIKHSGRQFNSVYKRITQTEREEFLKESANHTAQQKTAGHLSGMTSAQAMQEAERCLHCDCRKKENCKLRDLSTVSKAIQRVYIIEKPQKVAKNLSHSTIVFEKLKCIKCGLCIQTAQSAGDQTGFAFYGRGFDVEIAIPIEKSIHDLSEKAAIACAKNCPTGAISIK